MISRVISVWLKNVELSVIRFENWPHPRGKNKIFIRHKIKHAWIIEPTLFSFRQNELSGTFIYNHSILDVRQRVI